MRMLHFEELRIPDFSLGMLASNDRVASGPDPAHVRLMAPAKRAACFLVLSVGDFPVRVRFGPFRAEGQSRHTSAERQR